MQSAPHEFTLLERPYLMVTFIPYYEDESGEVWLKQSWHHDLVEHLSYLRDFTLCAPRLPKTADPELVHFDVPLGSRLRIVPLPPQTSAFHALLGLPRTTATLWRTIGDADVVHSSVIGWPYPLGWIANPFALLRRKRLVLVVESSWRRSSADGKSWMVKLFEAVIEAMARWSCNHADVALFTHPGYRDALFTRGRGAAYITPAVWVNENDILTPETAQQSWAGKLSEPVRLLVAGRLTAAKGIDVLLLALRMLDACGAKVCVDIIGVGDRRDTCIETGMALNSVRLSVLDPVPYGAPFFELVERYHALLIPSLSDEQPRVLFDANSRAVPAIASDTAGLRPYIEQGKSGWLLPPGDVEALAAAIERALASAPELCKMGMAALDNTRAFTHRAMHRTRLCILREHLA